MRSRPTGMLDLYKFKRAGSITPLTVYSIHQSFSSKCFDDASPKLNLNSAPTRHLTTRPAMSDLENYYVYQIPNGHILGAFNIDV